jgi:hypothetical protein
VFFAVVGIGEVSLLPSNYPLTSSNAFLTPSTSTVVSSAVKKISLSLLGRGLG